MFMQKHVHAHTDTHAHTHRACYSKADYSGHYTLENMSVMDRGSSGLVRKSGQYVCYKHVTTMILVLTHTSSCTHACMNSIISMSLTNMMCFNPFPRRPAETAQ